MPGLNLHTIYLSIIAVLLLASGAGAWYWHHETLIEGENKILVHDRAAADTQAKAVAAQQAKDLKDASDAVSSLQAELARIRAGGTVPNPPTNLRVVAGGTASPGVRCFAQRSGAVPAPSAAPGSAQPAHAAPGDVAVVPLGADSGFDLGPGMQLLATAGAVAAAYQHACAAFTLTTEHVAP